MSGKARFNGQGYMFLSPYYGKSRTSEILDRGMELDKLNALRKKKKEEAKKTTKPNNWTPPANTQKIHGKFKQIYNHIHSQNRNWALQNMNQLNEGHEEFNPSTYAEWTKRLNSEIQFAQWADDSVTDHTTFSEAIIDGPEDGGTWDFSSLAYKPLELTIDDWNSIKAGESDSDTEWITTLLKDQNIMMDDNNNPIPMVDGRLQDVNGNPIHGYNDFGEIMESKNQKDLIYNINYSNVDNMDLNDWSIGPNGMILYQGRDYLDNADLTFGTTLYKNKAATNPIRDFIDDVVKKHPWSEGGDKNKLSNGQPKTSYLNDVDDTILANLEFSKEKVGDEMKVAHANKFNYNIYQKILIEYAEENGNNNPSAAYLDKMISDPDFKLNPTGDLKKEWDAFIRYQGWGETDKAEYTVKNYALFKIKKQFMDTIGVENITGRDSDSIDIFEKFNFPSQYKLLDTEVSVHGSGRITGNSPISTNKMKAFGLNRIYNHGKKITNIQFRFGGDGDGYMKSFIENVDLSYGTDPDDVTYLDFSNVNMTLNGSWQNVYEVVLRKDTRSKSYKFVDAGDEKKGDKIVYMAKVLVNSNQLGEISKSIAAAYGGADNIPGPLQEVFKKLEADGRQFTIWVPVEEMYGGHENWDRFNKKTKNYTSKRQETFGTSSPSSSGGGDDDNDDDFDWEDEEEEEDEQL